MKYFMDRVYYTHDYQEHSFTDYAIKMGWGYKYYKEFFFNHENISPSEIKMKVKVKRGNYKRYPYMDTFTLYDPITGILSNDTYNNEYKNKLVLTRLDGTFGDYRDTRSRIINRFMDFIS